MAEASDDAPGTDDEPTGPEPSEVADGAEASTEEPPEGTRPLSDADIRDALPEDLDAAGYVGPYLFPNNNRRRIPAYLYWVIAAGCFALWLWRRGDDPVMVNGGMLAAAIGLTLIGLYSFVTGWNLEVDERDSLVVATRTVGFPVGHASAQMGWRGLLSRPTWRILLYSAEDPPEKRGLVLVDGVDGSVVEWFVEENPEDWSDLEYGPPGGRSPERVATVAERVRVPAMERDDVGPVLGPHGRRLRAGVVARRPERGAEGGPQRRAVPAAPGDLDAQATGAPMKPVPLRGQLGEACVDGVALGEAGHQLPVGADQQVLEVELLAPRPQLPARSGVGPPVLGGQQADVALRSGGGPGDDLGALGLGHGTHLLGGWDPAR